jgi:LytS/YehU family sensor histidine kinase
MLSELLDYMLYESAAESVAISREATLISNYLALERLRYGPHVRMTFDSDIVVDRPVPPLLFLPLVENSFKHGVSRGGEVAWVEIILRSTAGEIAFSVMNSIAEIPPVSCSDSTSHADSDSSGENSSGKSRSSHEGIGLRNVGERLALLYPGSHHFDVRKEADRFTVRLSILLSSRHSPEDR